MCCAAWIKLSSWVWGEDVGVVCVRMCVNLRHSTARLWHYGNAGITMKRAARGRLRANSYVQRLISRPTAVATIYPVRVTHEPAAASSNLLSSLFPRHTVSPLLISRFLHPCGDPCVPLRSPRPPCPPAHLFPAPQQHGGAFVDVHPFDTRHDYLLRFCFSVLAIFFEPHLSRPPRCCDTFCLISPAAVVFNLEWTFHFAVQGPCA